MKHHNPKTHSFAMILALLITCMGLCDAARAADYSVTVQPPYRARAIAAGNTHTVALRNDGTVVAWGNSNEGQSTVPAGLAGVTAIAAGTGHTVALKNDGTVVAWGGNSNNSTVPAGLVGVTAIAAGTRHTVALKNNGTVVAWGGSNFQGQTTVPPGLSGVKAVAAGSEHTVALKNDGTVVAWGSQESNLTDIPVGLTGVTAIAAGWAHTLALKNDGTVVAWGDSSYGFGQTIVPVGLSGVKAIAAGTAHNVALKEDGTVVAWGDSSYGFGQTIVPVGLSGVKAIAAGAYYTVALKEDGAIVAWGSNLYGETTIPAGFTGTIAIAAGALHTVALKNNGTVVAWGLNDYGQTTVPAGLAGITAIAAGGWHTVALKNNGTVVAWGADGGDGRTTVPLGLSGVTAIAAGGWHTVALKNNGTVVAWGNNAYGQTTVPTGLSGVTAITAGYELTAALKNDGTVVAWGAYGSRTVPTGLVGVTAIAAGKVHTLALKNNDTVVAWGAYYNGQTAVPAGLVGVTAITAGTAHNVALRNDGTVVAWGSNVYGQTTVPTGLVGVTAIAAGEGHTVALKKDGIVAWGKNGYGQSTVPPDLLTTEEAITNGSIFCETLVPAGADSACTITPDPGYHLAWFTVNGVDQRAEVSSNTYPITDIQANQWIAGGFAADTAPDAPAINTVTVGNQQATVVFSPPAWNGGQPITNYTVTANPGGKIAGRASSPITITGLTNGLTYTFTVTAKNAVDTGPPSAPSAPVLLNACLDPASITVPETDPDGSYRVQWGGSVTPGVTYILQEATIPSGATANWRPLYSGASLFYDISGRSLNTTYYYRVQARKAGCPDSNWKTSAKGCLVAIPAYTTLLMELSSQTILQNEVIQISGKLSSPTGNSLNLSGLRITLSGTTPSGTALPTRSVLTSDTYGHFSFGDVSGFAGKGQYALKVSFAGTPGALAPAESKPQTVLAGASAGYAIIVEGKLANDPGSLPSHNKTTNRIYASLRARGFDGNNIRYFNYDVLQEGVVAAPSKALLQTAITTWVKPKLSGVPAPLYIIMVDHGSPGTFHLGSETITPTELNQWLSTLEAGLNPSALAEKRVVVLGACYSGSFIKTLSKPGRVIITSASPTEESYKGPLEEDNIRSGEFFLEEFFGGLRRGDTVQGAFEEAVEKTAIITRSGDVSSRNALAPYFDHVNQHPLLDDNGDGVGSNILSSEGATVGNLYLGVGSAYDTNSSTNPAEILSVRPTEYLPVATNSILMWANANDNGQVGSAWIEIRAPSKVLTKKGGSNQLELGIPKVLLDPINNHWEKRYTSFTESGKYEIFYFVRDQDTSDISPLKRSVVYRNRLANLAPTTFGLVSPADNTTQKKFFLLDWLESNDADGLTYTVQIATEPTFAAGTVVYQKEEIPTSITAIDSAAGLEYGRLYYWRVIAVDAFGARTVSSAARRFSIPATNPTLGWVLYGKIIGGAGVSIGGADVVINNGTPKKSAADGSYATMLSQDTCTLTVSAAGYHATTVTVSNPGGSKEILKKDLALIPLDTTPPNKPVFSGVTPTKDTTPTWTWVSGGNGGNGSFRYRLNNATLTTGATLTTVKTFTPVTALVPGTHTLYVQERDAAGNWSATGSKQILVDLTPPTVGTVTPTPITTEQGKAQTFSAVYSAPEGSYDNIKTVDLLINPTSSVANGIRVAYDQTTNKLTLFNNAGTVAAGTCVPGATGVAITNTYGALNCQATTATKTGNAITMKWNLTPKAGFATLSKNIYLGATDRAANNRAWTQKGTWKVIAANSKPIINTLAPATLASPSGAAKTFTAVYSDADGFSNLKVVELLITTATTGTAANAIFVRYAREANILQLYNDAGTTLSPGVCKPGIAGSLLNLRGTLNCLSTTVAAVGNTMTVKWSITPKNGFIGIKDIKLKAIDNSNAVDGPIKKGSWSITIP